MNPQPPQPTPQATPIPIEDIVAPMGYFPYPWWWVAIAAVAALLVLGLLAWWFFLRKSPQKPLSAREQALQKLESMRVDIQQADPYQFGIAVSDVLRRFVESHHGIAATTQTSIEFLNSIRNRAVFGDEEKAALALFLEKSDLIKFAHAHATSQDSESLLETALMLVKGGVAAA